jgi:hypothetical protein
MRAVEGLERPHVSRRGGCHVVVYRILSNRAGAFRLLLAL